MFWGRFFRLTMRVKRVVDWQLTFSKQCLSARKLHIICVVILTHVSLYEEETYLVNVQLFIGVVLRVEF